jgi:hypothetical protein
LPQWTGPNTASAHVRKTVGYCWQIRFRTAAAAANLQKQAASVLRQRTADSASSGDRIGSIEFANSIRWFSLQAVQRRLGTFHWGKP